MRDHSRRRLCTGSCLLLILCSVATNVKGSTREKKEENPASAWRRKDYPDMNQDPGACRGSLSLQRLCDPDTILEAAEDVERVENQLRKTVQVANPCGGQDEKAVDVQVAVALARKIDLDDFPYGIHRETAAETFARYVHDQWGVGVVTQCGTGTGVLLFLSDLDRVIFASRGAALESVLTNRRLDMVIDNMKPHLQRQDYATAIVNAIDEIHYHIESGPPTFWERWVVEYGGLIWVFAIFGACFWAAKQNHDQRRKYARVRSHLTAIDRAKAEALKGHFQAVSCPICLEDFVKEGETEKGSDGLPLKLLRCGHVFDETCWSKWIESGQGHVDKCPVCKADVGLNSRGAAEIARDDEVPTAEDASLARDDGRGSSGNSPQDGEGQDHPQLPRRPSDTARRDDNNENRGNAWPALFGHQPGGAPPPSCRNPGSTPTAALALRRYHQDRIFRLHRLQAQYPQFIGRQQVLQWSEQNYDGQLAQDTNFLARDPGRSDGGGGGRRGGGSSGFGGGSSSGGRGGSW